MVVRAVTIFQQSEPSRAIPAARHKPCGSHVEIPKGADHVTDFDVPYLYNGGAHRHRRFNRLTRNHAPAPKADGGKRNHAEAVAPLTSASGDEGSLGRRRNQQRDKHLRAKAWSLLTPPVARMTPPAPRNGTPAGARPPEKIPTDPQDRQPSLQGCRPRRC